MDLYIVPLDVCLAINVYGPKWGMETLCVVQKCPWMSSRQNSLGAVGSGAAEGVIPLSAHPSPLVSLQGNWSDQDITAPKWVCFQVKVALTSFPFVIIPITLSIILDPTTTSTFSE